MPSVAPGNPLAAAAGARTRGVRALLPDGIFLALALGIVASVVWDAFGFRLITDSPGADYWEHGAVLRALLDDPWHPRHPLVASDTPSPRFGPHAVAIALVGRALGTDALGAMSIAALVNTLLFVAGIYIFFKEYFRHPWAPLFGLVVMFGSWLDAPHFSNVYKLSIYFSVAAYPSTTALAMMLFGLTVVQRALRDARERPELWALSALLFADVFVTHPLTAMLAFTAAGLLALTEPRVPGRRRLWVLGSLVAGTLLASLWPYYPALEMVAGGTVDRVQRGLETGEHRLHPFYETDMMFHVLGFALLAVLLFPYFFWRRKELFVPLGTLAMLAVFAASAWLDIPLGHRFLLLSVFFLQVGLVWLLLLFVPPSSRQPSESPLRWAVRLGLAVLAGGLLAFMTISNVVEARARFDRRDADTESITVRYGRRVAELAGKDAVVLGEALPSWPLPTFGPKIVTLHHRNPLIRDAAERDRAASRFFGPRASDAERFAILERFGVTHVVTSGRPSGRALAFLETHGQRRGLPLGRLLFRVDRKRNAHGAH